MPWPPVLGLFFVVYVGQALIQRTYSQKSRLPETVPPALSYLIGVMPLGIIVGLSTSHNVRWSWWLGLLLVIEGLFIGLYNWFSFMGIRRLPLARFQTVYQLYELVVIVLGWTLLGEGLSRFQVIGGLLLMVAATLAIRAPRQAGKALRGRALLTPGIALTLAAAVVMGIGLVAEKAALKHMDMGAYFIIGYGTQTLALLAVAAKDINRQTLRAIKSYDIKRTLVMGVFSATAGFFYIYCIVKADNISLITALVAFSLPLVALSGYVLLREREELKLLLGAIGVGLAGLLISAIH